MTPADIEAFRAQFGNTLPLQETMVQVIGDVQDTIENLAAEFAERGILPLSKAQENAVRLCFIFRTMRHMKNLSCLARAGLALDAIADMTPEDVSIFITENIERL